MAEKATTLHTACLFCGGTMKFYPAQETADGTAWCLQCCDCKARSPERLILDDCVEDIEVLRRGTSNYGDLVAALEPFHKKMNGTPGLDSPIFTDDGLVPVPLGWLRQASAAFAKAKGETHG